MRRTMILAGAALAAVTAAGVVSSLLAGEEARGQTTVTVEVASNYFCSPSSAVPCETTIAVGDTVSWQWVSGTHTVTECDDTFANCPPVGGGFDSGFRSAPATFTQTFNTAGSFEYHCAIHSSMQGRVIVAAQATATASAGPTPSPAPTLAPGQTASPTPRSTVAPAAIPASGGTPGGDGLSDGALLLLVAGGVLAIAFAGGGVRLLRRR